MAHRGGEKPTRQPAEPSAQSVSSHEARVREVLERARQNVKAKVKSELAADVAAAETLNLRLKGVR
jgi:hypothetical protein